MVFKQNYSNYNNSIARDFFELQSFKNKVGQNQPTIKFYKLFRYDINVKSKSKIGVLFQFYDS